MSSRLTDVLNNAESKWGDRFYLSENGKTETFGSFAGKVRALAAYLCDNGYSGQRVAVFSPNSIAWTIIDIAVTAYVGISVGFPKDWLADEFEHAVEKHDVRCIFYSETLLHIVNEIRPHFPNVRFISIENELDSCIAAGEKITAPALNEKTDDEAAKIVFTSGSTAYPKAVLLSIKNMFSGVEEIKKRAPLNERDVCYFFLPLSHTYGAIYNFLYSLVFGYCVYFAQSIKTMAQEMAQIHPTAFSAVPIVYTRFMYAADELHIPIKMLLGGNIRYLFCGGAKLPEQLRARYAAEGIELRNAYALSETASAFSIDYPGETDVDSVGTVFDNIDVRVLDPDDDGFGELIVKGENVFLGYDNDEQVTKAAFTDDGYFKTGDIGAIVNGRVHLRGRKDIMLTLPNGENVSPKAVSQKLITFYPNIRSVKIYMRDDRLLFDVYIDDSPIAPTSDELLNILPKSSRPSEIRFLSALLLLK